MNHHRTILPGGLIVLGILGVTLAASSGKAADAQPKITMKQAQAIALQAFPGEIVKAELEREGSGLRYSFDLRNGKRWREVGVDAMSGRVIENTPERANPTD